MRQTSAVNLPLLQQQAQQQKKNPALWRTLADACIAENQLEDAAHALEHLLRLAPQDWMVRFQLANQYYALSRFPEALDHYLEVMAQNPQSWEVRNNLALLLKHLGQNQLAEQCLLEALELKPDYFDALNNLGNLYRDLQQFDQARLCLDAALQLVPDSAELLTNLGLLYKEQGQLTQAIAVYRRALAQPIYPAALPYNYAIALIQSGDYQQGYAWYEKRWDLARLAERRQPYDAALPAWQGEPLSGKTLLVWCEQGLGDMLQMVRYLYALKSAYPDGRLLLRVDPCLARLLVLLPGLDQLFSTQQPMPAADYHVSVMSCPYLLQTTLDSIPGPIPYLTPDSALIAQWALRLGPRSSRPRVGVVWQSGQIGVGQDEQDRQTRSLPPAVLAALLGAVEVDWINLQVGGEAPAPEILRLMHQPQGEIQDFADSAAILAQLDALVSVDTAAAHLGGALGVPTVVLMRATGGNLFPAEGHTMPWYPSMHLLRQADLYDWQSVLAALPAALGFGGRE